MGVQQHEFPDKKEARQRLLSLIESGDTEFVALEHIDLSCRLLGPERLDAVLSRFDCQPKLALTHLTLSFNDIGPAGAARLATSAVAAQLESLELSGNELGDEGLDALLGGAVFTELASLTLSYNDITDAGAWALAKTKALPSLRELNLRRNNIGNNGIRGLCSHDFPQRLTRLNVEYNEFRKEGFELLDEAFDETRTHIW